MGDRWSDNRPGAQTHVFDTPGPVFTLRAGTWYAETLDMKKSSTECIASEIKPSLQFSYTLFCFCLNASCSFWSFEKCLKYKFDSLSLTQSTSRKWPVVHPPRSLFWTASAQSPVSICLLCQSQHSHTPANTHRRTYSCDSVFYTLGERVNIAFCGNIVAVSVTDRLGIYLV